MVRERKGQGGSERSPSPALRRPSNPTTVAKAVAAPDKPSLSGRAGRGKKKRGAGAAPGPVPASVTMSVAGLLRGEAPSDATEGERWGVLYRFVVRDADDRPIAPGVYAIRRHLLHLSSSGCFSKTEKGGHISIVALDSDGGAFDFVGLTGGELPLTAGGAGQGARRAPPGDGEERVLEYFSFELRGMTYAIPRSGFVLARSRRGGRLEVVRTPRAGGSVHGVVVPGLVTEGGGDTYVLALRD
jgi:hypothetical protein